MYQITIISIEQYAREFETAFHRQPAFPTALAEAWVDGRCLDFAFGDNERDARIQLRLKMHTPMWTQGEPGTDVDPDMTAYLQYAGRSQRR